MDFKTQAKGRPRVKRYALELPLEESPWTKTSSAALQTVFGKDDLGARALALYQSSLQPGTYRNYGSNLTGFLRFCDESSIAPLDITNAEIARYLAWMADQGTVAADSLHPYLSAINKFLMDHGKPPVALGPLIDGVRKGLANCQRDLAPTPERLPLPAPVALAILAKAEALLKVVHWDCPTEDNNTLLRACIASIASYVFFCRGECGACARTEDLVVNDTHITLRLNKEKGQQHLREGRKNTRQILVDDMPRVAKAIKDFFEGMRMMKTRARRWALTAREDKSRWTATTSTEWLQLALRATKHSPPAGFSWTSHSLRKGAASAANAIKVPLNDIRYAGGWSTNSTVLESKYIDFSMAPSKAAYICFGHLKRDIPAAQ
jgi:hypothetical protein